MITFLPALATTLGVRRTIAITCVLVALHGSVLAQDSPRDLPERPRVAPASEEARQAIKTFSYPQELEIGLFAAEPDVANPVAIHVDHQGRLFVCETFRQSKGIEDNRSHAEWLDDDLAAQSVADRIAYIRKHLGDKAIEYTRHDDRIRLLIDKDGDGQADSAEVFADHFNQIEMGTGAGVLSYRGQVYYTCIPHLWLLKDTDNDGAAEQREALQSGYGVRFAFRGHDSHGLIVGPDQRLYFSIGDRGYNIETEGKRFKDPASGAVFRCDLDGSNFEVVATGLRNPQELAFDDHGNLFTGDNNSDSGDKARWVYVVPGSDSGWRMYYQYLSDRGPFNREKIWQPYSPETTPAYIVPPVANIADGPSGLAYYPGTGLGNQFAGKFFLCDFRGGPANSGIRTFSVQPQGAFFRVTDMEQTFWRQLVTDLHFAPDGSLYVSDWVNGWEGLGKGRIYRYFNPQAAADPVVREVQKLLNEGMQSLPDDRLVKLLESPDRRIRTEAQFELVDRRETSILKEIALDEDRAILPRIHAIWGLEQLIRHQTDKSLAGELAKLLQSDDPEVRAQTAKFIGDCGATDLAEILADSLQDDQPRVRFLAAMSLGRQKLTTAFPASKAAAGLFQMIDENGDQDPILRHGAIMALARWDADEIWNQARHSDSRFVQKAAVVGIRKLRDPKRQAELLRGYVDPVHLGSLEEEVLVEVVRTIHDLPIPSLFPDLVPLTQRPGLSDPIMRRVLNAAFRLGQAEHATAIASVAAAATASNAMRTEAVQMLADWSKPSSRDRVLGDWRPLEPRPAEPAAVAIQSQLPALLNGTPELTQTVIAAASRLGIREIEPTVRVLLADSSNNPTIRADALRALATLEQNDIENIALAAATDAQVAVRIAAREVLAKVNPAQALKSLEQAIDAMPVRERQDALALLAEMPQPAAAELIRQAMVRLNQDEIKPDTRLDVLLAARSRKDPEIQRLVQQYENSRPQNDPLAKYLDCREGGDAVNGQRIFFEKTAVYCMRCHQVDGRGGEVGPNLSNIGKERDRRYLLEAIVNPDAAIAKGFETALIATFDGLTFSGIIKSEDDQTLTLVTPEGKTLRIARDDIEQIGKGKSSMPADLVKNLSLRELRDLVEYLSRQK